MIVLNFKQHNIYQTGNAFEHRKRCIWLLLLWVRKNECWIFYSMNVVIRLCRHSVFFSVLIPYHSSLSVPLMTNFLERVPRPTPSWYPEFNDMWISDTVQELDPPPRGVIFKFPHWVLGTIYPIHENTLAKMAFKVTSILIENFVMRRYSTLSLSWPILLLDWHFECFENAEQILINEFNIPASRAADLLPRLDPQFMEWWVREQICWNPGHVHFGVCERHRHTNYHHYMNLRW